MLARILSRFWWATLLRGLCWIGFGVFVLVRPGLSLLSLTLVVGAFLLIDGIANVVSAIGGRKENETWWVLLLEGLCGAGIGALTFVHPKVTAVALLYYVAFWAIASGFLTIVTAIRLRKEIQGEVLLGLTGALAIAFGAALLARPGAGMLSAIWLLGAFALLFGIVLIVLAIKTRRMPGRLQALGVT